MGTARLLRPRGRDVQPAPLPVRAAILRRAPELRSRFQSGRPLSRFLLLRDFLDENVLAEALSACRASEFATYCAFQRPGSSTLYKKFCRPNSRNLYVAIQERPPRPIPLIEKLADRFGSVDGLNALGALTGVRLRRLRRPTVVTHWRPESFLRGHTDYDASAPARLIVSISLTTDWLPSYGGATVFAWNSGPPVRIQPHLNTAVLFTPCRGSLHWVEQIAASAPPRRRFTWTATFM